MQLLISERAFVARFALPDDCRLVPPKAFGAQMSIQTIFRNVEFAADEPLRERRLPFENLFPSAAPDQLACFAPPDFSRLPVRLPVHPPILAETFDSRFPAEVPRWFEHTFLDEMRFDVVVHEQSLICRRSFFGKHRMLPVATALRAVEWAKS